MILFVFSDINDAYTQSFINSHPLERPAHFGPTKYEKSFIFKCVKRINSIVQATFF